MSRLVPRSTQGRVLAAMALFGAGCLLSLLFSRPAEASPYTIPRWNNTASQPDNRRPAPASLASWSVAHAVPCDGSDKPIADVGVNLGTGEFFAGIPFFSTKGVLGNELYGALLRTRISGATQLGCGGLLAGWETSVENLGNMVRVRNPYGSIDDYVKNGANYIAPPGVHATLVQLPSNLFQLTDKYGNKLTFDASGMPATGVDRNGNLTTYNYDSSHRVTSIVTDLGKSIQFAWNANNHITSITDPEGDVYAIEYDGNGHATKIKYPPLSTGVPELTIDYDGNGLPITVEDGEPPPGGGGGGGGGGGPPQPPARYDITYDASKRVTSIKFGACTTSFSYAAGVTTVTDARGNVHRHYFSGNKVTRIETLVGGVPSYIRRYGYAGEELTKIVLPRGNRIDLTWDPRGNLLGRRQKEQDTDVNGPDDIVHSWTYSAGNFRLSHTDPRGNQWLYARDAAGNLTQVTNPTVTSPVNQPSSRTYQVNAKGQLTQATDEEGNITEYQYYAAGNSKDLLQKVIEDPTGLALTTTLTHDPAGNIATLTDPRNNTFLFTFDAYRRLLESKAPAPLNYRIKYEYDARGFLVRKDVENIDKDGNLVAANPWIRTTYGWSDRYDLLSIEEEIDASTTRTTSFEYDCNSNRIRMVKPEGNKEKWEYNEMDWMVAHERGEGDPKVSRATYEQDGNGNTTKLIDGRGNATLLTYDLFDRLTRRTNALGHYTDLTLDKNGNVTEVQAKDSAGTQLQRESYSYDERNRRWRRSLLFREGPTTHPDAVTTLEFLKTGELRQVTSPAGNNTIYQYDAALRLTKVIDPVGNDVSYALDANGNRTSVAVRETDGLNPVTHAYERSYDALDRMVEAVEIDRNDATNRLVTAYSWDSRSNLVFRVNAEGNPVRLTYDPLDRLTKRERALAVGTTIDDFTSAQITQWGFDKNNRLISHKDDGPNQSTWAFDALDRVTSMTFPDGNAVGYQHDKNDNVTKTTDPAGNVVDDLFDALSRNTSRTVTLAAGFLGTTSETRTYDPLNRIVTNQDNDYLLDYEYAALGLRSLVRKETQSYVGMTAYPLSVSKTYDSRGNVLTESYPAGANLNLGLTYNQINQLVSVSDGTNTISSYSYIGFRRKTITFQNGATRTNSFTGFRSEVASIDHQTSAQQTIVRLDYGYNKVHDRLFERFGAAGSGGDAFSYDKLRRLTKAWMGSSTPSSPSGNAYVKLVDYSYDDDGNRTSLKVTPYQQAATTTGYTTNNLNQYTNIAGTGRTHDANGNVTDNGTFTFKYDYRNQIVQAKRKSDGVIVGSYRYDALGRRVEKNTAAGVQRFVLCTEDAQDDLGNLGNVMCTYDGAGNWKQSFVHHGDVDDIAMLEQADVLDFDSDGNTTERTRSFYHSNALGSVMEITDANQAKVVSYRYDPYGKVTITRNGQVQTTDPLAQGWGYTGRFRDEESGLLYYRARFYDPTHGRFLQRDPTGYADAPSLYGYVFSSPLNWVDPSGLQGFGLLPGSTLRRRHARDTDLEMNPAQKARMERILREHYEDLIGIARGVCVEAVTAPIAAKGAVVAAKGAGAAAKWFGKVFGKLYGKLKKARKARKAAQKAKTYSKLKDHPSVGPGKRFTQSQKKSILDQNKKMNKGVLRSDKSKKELVPPKQHKKGVTPPANEAHVDHVVPKSSGGSNSSGNAQVLSRAENLNKSNK